MARRLALVTTCSLAACIAAHTSAIAQAPPASARLYLPSALAWHGETDCQPFIVDPSIETAADAPEVRRRTRITPWDEDWRVYRMTPNWLVAGTGSSLPLTNASGVARTGQWALRFDGSIAQGKAFVQPWNAPRAFEPGEVRQAFLSFWYRLDMPPEGRVPSNAIEVHVHGIEDEVPAWTQGEVLLGRLTPAAVGAAGAGRWRLAAYEVSEYLEGYDLGLGRWNLVVPTLTSRRGDGIDDATWIIDDIRLNVCFNPR